MRSTPVAFASILVALSLLLGLGLRPGPVAAAVPCWKSVMADWSRDGSIDRRYAPDCYRQAMLNAPTDLKIYSTLEDALQNALQKSLRLDSARRLAGAHASPVSLGASGGSSSVSFLALLIAGLGLGVVACSLAATFLRRRRSP
jgi:hypothetical protein